MDSHFGYLEWWKVIKLDENQIAGTPVAIHHDTQRFLQVDHIRQRILLQHTADRPDNPASPDPLARSGSTIR